MKRPFYTENEITLYHEDCLTVMKALHPNSIDAIVTDPPYGLTQNKQGGSGEKSLNLNSPAGRSRITTGGGFMGMKWDHGVPGINYWTEALRVAKPGAHLLAFGGTRTYHRLACAIEDSGWEIRDCIMWVFGSGFPKSLDVSKSIDKEAGATRQILGKNPHSRPIDGNGSGYTGPTGHDPHRTAPSSDGAKRFSGFGTALKPAYEPILIARKQLDGTVAQNVLKWGTGAMNIDECRVAGRWTGSSLRVNQDIRGGNFAGGHGKGRAEILCEQNELGRWPANLIHDGSEEVLAAFPNAPGKIADAKIDPAGRKTQNIYGTMKRGHEASANSDNDGEVGFKMKPGARRLDAGSAARFFYTAKASASDRGHEEWDALPLFEEPAGQFKNTHPTVKPLALMRYLLTLVSRDGGKILDPFLGSGTTAVAAKQLGRQCIGIEQEEASCTIAARRVARSKDV